VEIIKKRYYLIVTFIIEFSMSLYCEPVDELTARIVAVNFFNEYKSNSYQTSEINNIFKKESNQICNYYIFNFKTGGFVIVSADNSAIPILGFSFSPQSSIPTDTILWSLSFYSWMRTYELQIEEIRKKEISDSATYNLWKNIINNNFSNRIKSSTQVTQVGPLLESTWDQGCYYNSTCPIMQGGPCGHALAGCVAVAMAQVIRYWEFPIQNNNIDWYGYFVYSYEEMPNYLYSENWEVAHLVNLCGRSVNMDYGETSSGAYFSDVDDALEDIWKYNNSLDLKNRFWYSDNNWKNMMYSDLDNGRPILYSGGDDDARHSFVCDGYGYNDNENYFSFNFGWNGSGDGWYTIDAINPLIYSFNDEQKAIFSIKPNWTYDHILKNITIEPEQGRGFRAVNTISVAGDGTYFDIKSNEIYGGYCKLVAGDRIILKPGFQAEQRSKFHALIREARTYGTYKSETVNNNIGTSNEIGIVKSVINFDNIFNIYPNPNNGEFDIEFYNNELSDIKIEIINISGHTIYKRSTNTSELLHIVIPDNEKGLYIIKIIRNQDIFIHKIIVQ